MKIIIVSLFVLTLLSCTSDSYAEDKANVCNDYTPNAIEQANWFLGKWQNDTGTGLVTEEWTQKNDSVYIGESSLILDKEIMFHGKMSIEKNWADWYYKINVTAHDNKQHMSFKLTSVTPNQLIFENPEHDFPNRINYVKIAEDSIMVFTYGIKDGKEIRENIPMKKIK